MTLDKFAAILDAEKREFISSTGLTPNVVSIGTQCKYQWILESTGITIAGLRVILNADQMTSHVLLYTTATLTKLG